VDEMKKIISLLAFVAILMSPLISYAASQPTFDWSGGPKYSQNMVTAKTLAEISKKLLVTPISPDYLLSVRHRMVV
jgi:hypothetical protein